MVIFILSSNKRGLGGHHYSVRDLSRAFKEQDLVVRTFILNSGSLALDPQDFLDWKEIAKIGLEINLREVQGVFCFDNTASYTAMSLINYDNWHKLAIVKPGWINSKSLPRFARNIICFSKENYDYYSSSSFYTFSKVHYIPNRVYPLSFPNVEFTENKGVLIAARITRDKSHLFESGIRYFRSDRCRLKCLTIAGDIADQGYFSELQNSYPWISFITNPVIIRNLSSIFVCYDEIIGMGRVVAEALSLGKRTLSPVNNTQVVVPVVPKSFPTFLEFNFSYRTEMNLSELNNIWREYRSVRSDDLQYLFTDNLSAENAVEKYRVVMNSMTQELSAKLFFLYSSILAKIRVFYLKNKWIISI